MEWYWYLVIAVGIYVTGGLTGDYTARKAMKELVRFHAQIKSDTAQTLAAIKEHLHL